MTYYRRIIVTLTTVTNEANEGDDVDGSQDGNNHKDEEGNVGWAFIVSKREEKKKKKWETSQNPAKFILLH